MSLCFVLALTAAEFNQGGTWSIFGVGADAVAPALVLLVILLNHPDPVTLFLPLLDTHRFPAFNVLMSVISAVEDAGVVIAVEGDGS